MQTTALNRIGSRGSAPQAGGLPRRPQPWAVRRGRTQGLVTAKVAAHSPPVSSNDATNETSTSGCPFLAALPSPPMVQVPWWRRLQQLTEPLWFQRTLIGNNTLVQTPSQMLMPAVYMPGTIEGGKAVFAGEGDITRQFTLGGIGTLMGRHNLLTLQEPAHKHLRALLQPAFTAEAVGVQMPRIVAVMDKYLQRWADAEGTVSADKEFKLMTFDFIVQIVLGRDVDEKEVDELSQLFKVWTAGLFAWPFLDIPFSPFNKAMKARNQLLARFQSAIDLARAQAASGEQVEGVIRTLVECVDEEGNRLTDQQIGQNILLLLFAGHDTSSSTLTQALANMADTPHVLPKLREEQQRLQEKYGPEITTAVLKEMVYADAVIKETLRKDTIVPALSRIADKDFELNGYGVPEGTSITVPLKYFSLHDPRWVDAEGDLSPSAFNPERMLTPEGSKPGWQMPFGYGPRYCLGYAMAMGEMKVFLALLARHYDFTADTNTEWVQVLGKKPKNGLPTTYTRL